MLDTRADSSRTNLSDGRGVCGNKCLPRCNGRRAQASSGRGVGGGGAQPLAASVASSRAQARAQGRLLFDPVVPSWAVPESAVYVSDASRIPPAHAAVAFVYTFPIAADFPADGRVVMVQRPTEESEASFDEIVRSNGSDNFRVIEVNGRPGALLVEAHGIGRVRVIRNGVVIDITGPATPSASAVRLARDLG